MATCGVSVSCRSKKYCQNFYRRQLLLGTACHRSNLLARRDEGHNHIEDVASLSRNAISFLRVFVGKKCCRVRSL